MNAGFLSRRGNGEKGQDLTTKHTKHTKGATGIDRESEEDSEQWSFYFTEEYKGNEGVRHGIEVGFNIWSDFDTGFVRENAKASIWRCFGEASIFAHQAPTDRLEDSQ